MTSTQQLVAICEKLKLESENHWLQRSSSAPIPGPHERRDRYSQHPETDLCSTPHPYTYASSKLQTSGTPRDLDRHSPTLRSFYLYDSLEDDEQGEPEVLGRRDAVREGRRSWHRPLRMLSGNQNQAQAEKVSQLGLVCAVRGTRYSQEKYGPTDDSTDSGNSRTMREENWRSRQQWKRKYHMRVGPVDVFGSPDDVLLSTLGRRCCGGVGGLRGKHSTTNALIRKFIDEQQNGRDRQD
ncbi:hypothetical protein DFH07DRAFT_782982 [Mycena maculata]|uniref:Uncharacterized protein n=1 Tax=Mycena maculata TaxID=230809 RepID=A0AAD7HPS3_9AGAR|nr:hypothetical protein DFH07DRAFT_782982 [Mycena maculata]